MACVFSALTCYAALSGFILHGCCALNSLLSSAVSEEQCLYQIYLDELYGGLPKPNEDEKKKHVSFQFLFLTKAQFEVKVSVFSKPASHHADWPRRRQPSATPMKTAPPWSPSPSLIKTKRTQRTVNPKKTKASQILVRKRVWPPASGGLKLTIWIF